MPITLYPELIDLIIDEIGLGLDKDNICRATLSACSLTSWFFHESARKYLFRQIDIKHAPSPEEEQRRLENLIDILKLDPSRSRPSSSLLSSDVRSLRMDLIRPPISHTGAPDLGMTSRIQMRWDHFVSKLPILLQHLSSVEKFTLQMWSAKHSWASFGQAVTSTLLQFFAFPSLTSLEFRFIDKLPIISIMSCCHNLRNLSLYSAKLVGNEIITTSAPIAPLESLFLHNLSGVMPLGLSYFYNSPFPPEKEPPMSWLFLKSLTVAGIPGYLFDIGEPGQLCKHNTPDDNSCYLNRPSWLPRTGPP